MQLKDHELINCKFYKHEFLQKEGLDLYQRMRELELFQVWVSKISTDCRETFEERLE